MANGLNNLRTWVEISRSAARHNYRTFRKLIKPRTKLWGVVKSNAYGHGLVLFSKLLDSFGVDGFCVDSIVEGIRLREEGVKKPILVLGLTLPMRLAEARKHDITVSVSNFETLKVLRAMKEPPRFHVKIDSGMHRQGFYIEDVPRVIKFFHNQSSIISGHVTGIFTHFAAAKDVLYPSYTERQFSEFQKAKTLFQKAGFRGLCEHAAATGGTVLDSKYHGDAVRVGMGLYGFHGSPELELQFSSVPLKPVLAWKTIVGEVKRLRAGDYIGYDITERIMHPGLMAVLPIGYWHGFPRSLSSVGSVLVRGKHARVLGRVSMDMTVVLATGTGAKMGDVVTLLGKSRSSELRAMEVGRTAGTSHYELLTRLNPLMERIVI